MKFSVGDVDMMKKFIAGLAKGLKEKTDTSKLEKCIAVNDKVLENIKNAADKIRNMQPEMVKEGCKLLIDNTLEILRMIGPCMTDFKKFNQLQSKLKTATPDSLRSIMMKIGRAHV